MGYYVKYHELQNTYHRICNQINEWSSQLENAKQKMQAVALMQEIKGETANSIRSYILEIHIPLINFLQQVLAEYKAKMQVYSNDYHQIDSNSKAKIAIDRLDEQITNIHAGIDAFQAIEESVSNAVSMVAGLVSVSAPSGVRITNNYERLGQKVTKLKDEVGECEYSHLTTDFDNIEDMLSNILQIINGQSQKSNVTITAYQAGSISKVPAFQKLQEAAATQNNDFNGSTKESEDIITGLGTKSIIDVMRDEFTNLVKENKDKLNNIKKKILDNLNLYISKNQYDDFNTQDGLNRSRNTIVGFLDFILQSRKAIIEEYPMFNVNPIFGTNVEDTKKLYEDIKDILLTSYDNIVKVGANSNIPIISDYSRGLEGDNSYRLEYYQTIWLIYLRRKTSCIRHGKWHNRIINRSC
jgi:hypothetical protein